METFASDINGECLVTDLVHELSSGLEIPFLLDDNIRAVNKVENTSPLDTAFYEESVKETWGEDNYFNYSNCYEYLGENTFSVKGEINNDFQSFLEKNNIVRTHSASAFSGSGSGSGSGSECSSTEIWLTKGELDTPPVTPPDERISSEHVFLLSSDDLKFMPICTEENKLDNDFKYVNKKARIQPKPLSTDLKIFDSQSLNFQTVMCSVFNDSSSNKKHQDINLESKIFLSANVEKRKPLLSKKDSELLQAKRKQERMIRNRESAYLSRKRKKEHLAHLEKQVVDLQTENKSLKMENCNLKERLAKYEQLEPLPEKKHKNVFTESPRKTTALLALLFTVCLNIGSFSSLINERKIFKSDSEIISGNKVPNYASELRGSRSLLWVNNDFQSLNSTYTNLTKTSCGFSVNQTELIRLESELRRWIGGDEDYSRQTKHNVSKISQYFSLGERPKQKKNILKEKQRILKPNIQKKNLEMYQMNLLNFNTFFEAIHRRDDTFYLVSFSSDHLLLPALSHNQTSRPKMSLMLPASFSNATGPDQVEMMQIDCEVTNTQLLSVNENDIPSHMRPYSNTTTSKNKTTTKVKKFEEYFVSDLPVTLVPAEKVNFKVGKNDFIFANSSRNHTKFQFKTSPPHRRRTNLTELSSFEIFNFNMSSYKNYESVSQYLMYNRTLDVFLNETYKQDDFISSSRKNLLKLLMVGPTASNPRAVKFTPKEFFYRSFRNSTKFLFN